MEENNKLIAEFMGYIYEDDRFFMEDSNGELVAKSQYENLHHELKYDSSWDWLMPVVDKIESLNDTKGDPYRFTITMYDASIKGTDIEILGDSYYEGSEQKIVSTYQAVVEFIKDYNNGKD